MQCGDDCLVGRYARAGRSAIHFVPGTGALGSPGNSCGTPKRNSGTLSPMNAKNGVKLQEAQGNHS